MMIGRSTRRKKNILGVRPGALGMRKKWINAFLKRLALIDLASTNIKDGTAREEICKTIKGYRKLVPDLRDKAAWPDAKLPFIVKSSIRSLELSVAVIQFGLDSLRLSLHLAMLYRNQEVHCISSIYPCLLTRLMPRGNDEPLRPDLSRLFAKGRELHLPNRLGPPGWSRIGTSALVRPYGRLR